MLDLLKWYLQIYLRGAEDSLAPDKPVVPLVDSTRLGLPDSAALISVIEARSGTIGSATTGSGTTGFGTSGNGTKESGTTGQS